MKFTSLALIAGILFSLSSHATTMAGKYVYFSAFHFSKNAFGKTVKSVMAHTGVSIVNAGCGMHQSTYWDNTQDVQMTDKGDYFYAAAKLSTNASMCQSNAGVIVQYWVDFTDGSHMVTNVASVPKVESKYAGQSTSSAQAIEASYQSEVLSSPRFLGSYSLFVDESFAD